MVKPKILVADDNSDFRETLSDALSSSGQYEVIPVESPEHAEKAFNDNLIHLALIDVRMRNDRDVNDKSGLDLCKRMDPTVARILMTYYTGGDESWQLVRESSRPTENRHRLADGFFSKGEIVESTQFLKDLVQRVLDEEFEIIPQRRIGVLTSGGDSPGMNAAIWSIVRTAMNNDIEVMGIQNGYYGLVHDQMRKLKWSEVSDIVEQAGTILGTARYKEFSDPKIRERAVENINRKHICGLVVIGGDGSMKGAQALAGDLQKQGKTLLTVAIPGTIDNDIWGTDMSLGAASAANAMTEEMRNMIQPAKALKRIFVCEVMGANCGFLAIQAALGIAADVVIIPEHIIEVKNTPGVAVKDRVDIIGTENTCRAHLANVAEFLEAVFAARKRYGFVVVAEGIKLLTGKRLNGKYVEDYLALAIEKWSHANKPDVRLQELGYTVRGVPPVQFDVQLGAALGAHGVLTILRGQTNCMVGWEEGKGIIKTSFDEVVSKSNLPPKEILNTRPKWQEAIALQQALASPPKLREHLKSQGNCFVFQQ